MNPTPKEYGKMTKKASPPSNFFKNSSFAFLCGGAICAFGQGLYHLYQHVGLNEQVAKAMVSVSLIAIVAVLTGLNVYDDFAKIAGAGSLVPITGFANAMVSPAIEYKPEGFILGVGANMFKIAGPVIVYGVAASVIYGLIYGIMQML